MSTSDLPRSKSTAAGARKSSRARRLSTTHAGHVTATGIQAGAPQFVEQLLAIASADYPPPVVRAQFRQALINQVQAVGCCFLTDDAQRGWQIVTNQSTGRVPSGQADKQLAKHCAAALKNPQPTLVKLGCLEDASALLNVVPGRSELVLLVLKNAGQAAKGLQSIPQFCRTYGLWQQTQEGRESVWQRNSLAAILDLVSRATASRDIDAASELITNELARALGCTTVALGLQRNQKLRVVSVSGIGQPDRGSKSVTEFQQSMQESITRNAAGIWPPRTSDENFLLLAHRQLAHTVQCEAVASECLSREDGTSLGALIFCGTKRQLHDEQFARFIASAAPALGSALGLLQKTKTGRFKKFAAALSRNSSWGQKAFAVATAGCVVALMFLPVTYQVRCRATVEPVARRFAVAPFDGLIEEGFVEPGDVVSEGQTLARIDGRTLRWELSGVTAEQQQSLRQREMELSEGNISKTLLAELENQRLDAERRVLEFRQDHLLVKSPIDGVVLSGSLERAAAASITTGQVLFEIGPTSPIKIEIAIPADDIAQVQVGHPASIWIEGLEDQAITRPITRLHPRSEIRDARNVFVAEIEVDNVDHRLRPGMKGYVRVDCDKKSLGWSLFHKPMNYLRSRLTWW